MLKRLPVRLRWRIASATASVVGDLRNQDDVGAASDAGAEREPAGIVAHNLDNDDAVVAVRRAVQPVDRVGRDTERRIEAEGQSVMATSLSMVLGRVITFSPFSSRRRHSSACRRRPGRPGRRGDGCGRWRDRVGHVKRLLASRHARGFDPAGAEDVPPMSGCRTVPRARAASNGCPSGRESHRENR